MKKSFTLLLSAAMLLGVTGCSSESTATEGAGDQKEAITAVAEDFPEQKNSYIDADLDHPTVRTICTIWPEQTFLTGVIAGLATQSNVEGTNDDNVVGVILGMDNPNLRTGLVGFEAGVKYVNPTAEVLQARFLLL